MRKLSALCGRIHAPANNVKRCTLVSRRAACVHHFHIYLQTSRASVLSNCTASMSLATLRCARALLLSNCCSYVLPTDLLLSVTLSAGHSRFEPRDTSCLEMPSRHIYPRCAHSIGAFALRFLALSRLCRFARQLAIRSPLNGNHYMSIGHRGQWISSFSDHRLRPPTTGKQLENCDIGHRKELEQLSA